MWTQVLRFLGFTALGELARRLPLWLSFGLSLVLVVGAQLFPLWLVRTGRWTTKDLLLVFSVEAFLVTFDGLIRLLTYQSRRKSWGIINWGPWMTGSAVGVWIYFFCLCTITPAMPVVAGVEIARNGGLGGSRSSWILGLGLMLLGYLVSLGLQWFALGQRWRTHRIWPTVVMAATKMVAMFVAVMFIGTRPATTDLPTGVVVVVVIKIACDVLVMSYDLLTRLRPELDPVNRAPRPGSLREGLHIVSQPPVPPTNAPHRRGTSPARRPKRNRRGEDIGR